MENTEHVVTFNVNNDRHHTIELCFIDPYYTGRRIEDPHKPLRAEIIDPEKQPEFGLPVTSEGIVQQYASIYFEDEAMFDFDFENLRLIEYYDPKNIINLRDVRDTGSGYEFYYDPDRRNVAQVPDGFEQGDTGPFLVRFRHLVSLHPYAMSVCNHVPFGTISVKTDKEFMEKVAQWKVQQQTHQKANRILARKRWGKSM